MNVAVSESQWLPLIYEEMQNLRKQNELLQKKVDELQSSIKPESLTVDTNEAALMLDVTAQTIRKWQAEGKMPKLVSNPGQNFVWTRQSIKNMALGISKGGRKRNSS